jgi:kynurenine formamidase
MVGVDTLSVDAFYADNDPAHNILLSNKILVAENIKNLEKLYGKKGYFIMLPLLIKDGSASPVRPIVLI